LVRNDLRELIRSYASADAKITQQIITLLHVADAVNEQDFATVDDLLNGVSEDVYEE